MRKQSANGWNILFYSENIDTSDKSTTHEFTLKVNNVNIDKSGIIIGVMRASNKSVSLSAVKTNFIAISGKGFQYNYNVLKKYDYDLSTGDIVKISIDLRKTMIYFNVKGVEIGTGDLSSVLGEQICIGVMMHHKDNEVQYLEYKKTQVNTTP